MSSSSSPTTSSSAKIELWKKHSASKTSFDVTNCFDLTTSPCKKRASFPYPILPPLRHLTYDQLINEFLRLPSVGWTALGSFVSGVLLTLAARWCFSSSSSATTMTNANSASRPLRIIISLIGALLAVKWVSTRFPKRQLVSQSLNVSSHSGGPCVVTGPVLTLTNSHAGTHADTPSHFLHHQHHQCGGNNNNNKKDDNSTSTSTSNYSLPPKFDKLCYAGDCVILDLSASLAERNSSEIDDAVLQDAFTRANTTRTTSFAWEDVFRLIIRTTTTNDNDNDTNDQWRDDFAYFSVAGASFLTQKCPKLLMIGTDSPSVDRVDASPLIQNAHGVFWKHRVAIVENIDCSSLFAVRSNNNSDNNDNNPVLIRGQVQCVFNDAQKFEDAEGCNVLFYPE